MTSYFDKDKFDRGLPRISSASRATERSLTLLDDEIERLRHNHSAPSFGSSGVTYAPSPPQSKKVVQDVSSACTNRCWYNWSIKHHAPDDVCMFKLTSIILKCHNVSWQSINTTGMIGQKLWRHNIHAICH